MELLNIFCARYGDVLTLNWELDSHKLDTCKNLELIIGLIALAANGHKVMTTIFGLPWDLFHRLSKLLVTKLEGCVVVRSHVLMNDL